MRYSFVLLLATALGNPWYTVRIEPDDASAVVLVPGDPTVAAGSSPATWHTWVVFENTSSYPVHVAFELQHDLAKVNRTEIKPGGRVALRVGPGDVAFRFLRLHPDDPTPGVPVLVRRATESDLKRDFRDIVRL
jgi:hypothetical protein